MLKFRSDVIEHSSIYAGTLQARFIKISNEITR